MTNIELTNQDFIEFDINGNIFNTSDEYVPLGVSFAKGKSVSIKREKDREIRIFFLNEVKKYKNHLSNKFVMDKVTKYLMDIYEKGLNYSNFNILLNQLKAIEPQKKNIFVKIYNLSIDIDYYDADSFTLFNPIYFMNTYKNKFMYRNINDRNTINTDNSTHTAIVFKNVEIVDNDQDQIKNVIDDKIQQFINLIGIALNDRISALELDTSFVQNSTEYHILNEKMNETSACYSSDNSTYIKGNIILKGVLFFDNNQKLFKLLNEQKNLLQNKIYKSAMWLGKSLRNENIGDAFLQEIIALECLLTRQEKNYCISPSIGYSLAETLALLVGNTKENRINILKDIKKLYGLRSSIVHSGKSDILISSYYQLFDYIKKGIYIILDLIDEKKLQNIDELYNYIDDIKFS